MNSLSSVSKAFLANLLFTVTSLVLTIWEVIQAGWSQAAFSLISTIVALASVLWLRRANTSINKAIRAMGDVANGRLGGRILHIRGQGNIGQMLHNINAALDQIEAFAKETDAAMQAALEKRFYRQIQLNGFHGDFARYSRSVNKTLQQMDSSVKQLNIFEGRMLRDAVTVTMTVNEGAIANARIVSGIRNAVLEAQGMAASTEEMVAGINEISTNSNQASQLSAQAQELTDATRSVVTTAVTDFVQIEQVVGDAAARVAVLARASEAIGDIVQSIETIAAQTNLLALNATIEAARAGDAGKGFAVVAGEVKNLSNQTARATEDISQRVANLRQEMTGIVDTMNRGTEVIANSRTAMHSMSSRMEEISHMVSDTSARMSDISRVLSQQAAAANQISAGVQHVAAQAEENAKAIDVSSSALAGIEQEMTSLLNTLGDRDIPHKVVLLAKSDHVTWRKRLMDMMIGHTSLNPQELSNHENCRLGKWYYGPASLAYRDHPAFIELEECHRNVHRHGLESVRLHNAGQIAEASAQLELVEAASVQVMRCLDRLLSEKAVGTAQSRTIQVKAVARF